MSDRVSWVEDNGVIECRIRALRNRVFAVMMPFWIIAWVAVIIDFTAGPRHAEYMNPVVILVWLVPWIVLGSAAMVCWFWAMFGREIISIRYGRIVIKHDVVLGAGWTRSFDFGGITGFGKRGPFGPPNMWSLTLRGIKAGDENARFHFKATVGFNYLGKRREFGLFLTQEEAEAVVERLKPYLPESALADG